MLAAAHRLRRRAEFAVAIRSGRRSGRDSVVVHLCLPVPGVDDRAPVRAGLVVSRAVGNAVIRNLVRRRLRHLIRERLAVLPPGVDVVVRALPAAAERGYAELGTDLDSALSAALDSRRTVRLPRSARGREPRREEAS